jgi:modulator of FtsH protease HflC
MALFKSLGLFVAAAIALVAWLSFFTVDEREKALVLRFGDINRIVDDPGLHFKLPIADVVVPISDQVVTWRIDDIQTQVVDGRRYVVDAVTFARVIDSQKFRETVGADLSRAKDRIETRLNSALRQTYGRRSFEAALSKERDVMMREIREQVRPEALGLGIEIVDVRIRRTDLMPDVLDATYKRMRSEREAQAANLRGLGNARKTQIEAETDREVVETLAEANRLSEITRGEGDATRNKVFAEAFQRDPEFFSFYRSMQAYASSLSGPGTTMVLSPDSEFFKYLGIERTAPPPKLP